jgi:polysaccharide biosynthesis transport protein
MQPEQQPTRIPTTTSKAVRHHLPVVLVCLLLGLLAAYHLASGTPTTYTSTARVLVNPSVGNPFVPTPASVRQDELTSLETEAQVVQSNEVLDEVAQQVPSVSTKTLQRQVQVFVPANTQILEISFTGSDPVVAQKVVNTVAQTYLDNRADRFEELNNERIQRVEARTETVVADMKAAADAAQHGGPSEKTFESNLGDALRNELVSLRAQRTALENSASPPGAVIAPAQVGKPATDIKAMAEPIGVVLLALVVGCLIAVLLERWRGVVRSAAEVEAVGVPVVGSVPVRSWRERLLRRGAAEAIDTTIRRVRATILELDPRPDVITVAPSGRGRSDGEVAEAVAESFAKAGHRVVLVRTDGAPTTGLGVDDKGLAQALLHERLSVLDLLQPSVEPLLSLLSDGGFTAQSRELLVADRVRSVLSPLVKAGHMVVIQSAGLDTPEGEAFLGAADLSLVVITTGRTRPAALEQVAIRRRDKDTALGAIVVGKEGATRRTRLPLEEADSDSRRASVTDSQRTRARR